MFFNKKKKKRKDDRERLTGSERTIDSKEFIIHQIANEEESKSAYTKSRFISPIFGSKVKDEIVIPEIPRQTGDHDLKYDRFRTKPKLTKEDMIARYGSEYHEFDMVSGENLGEALDRQNKRTKHHLDRDDPEVYVPSKEEIQKAGIEEDVPDFMQQDTDIEFIDQTREKTSINDFFEKLAKSKETRSIQIPGVGTCWGVKTEKLSSIPGVRRRELAKRYLINSLNKNALWNGSSPGPWGSDLLVRAGNKQKHWFRVWVDNEGADVGALPFLHPVPARFAPNLLDLIITGAGERAKLINRQLALLWSRGNKKALIYYQNEGGYLQFKNYQDRTGNRPRGIFLLLSPGMGGISVVK